MKAILKKAKGFTLVELMVVIVIVGILAAVAIPKFITASHKAKASEFPTVLTSIYTAQEAQQAESGSYASSITGISGFSVPNSKWFSYTTAPVTVATSDFIATATVALPFGEALEGQTATINQAGTKMAHDKLHEYCPNWRN